MNKIEIATDVEQAIQQASDFLIAKGFKIFAVIDHSANAAAVDLKLAPSQVIIFGNPLAGTKLMQTDITMSLDLPLRVAFIEEAGNVYMLHQTAADYQSQYNVKAHPVIDKIEQLYSALAASL